MPAAHRTIVITRHAKADDVGTTDFERELTRRGSDDAVAAGSWLAGQGIRPDLAIVSAATRTRQTWAALAHGAAWDLEPTYDGGLYAADPETTLDLLRILDDDVRTVVVVGHNPTMAYLAAMLDDGDGDVEAGNQIATGFPTSAMAVFSYDGDWADLGGATARVTGFHVARA